MRGDELPDARIHHLAVLAAAEDAVVAHALGAEVLLAPLGDRALGIVERNARAQARIIEDVLDISRIVSGKLRLDIAPVDVREIALAALETVRPAADAKAITVDLIDDSNRKPNR